MQERGLKFMWIKKCIKIHQVAPYAGAWIEICDILVRNLLFNMSLLMQERGLKL